MRTHENKFGSGTLYSVEDIYTPNSNIYVACTACMSVWSDFLSYIETHKSYKISAVLDKTTTDAIVLSCQVTDLAIYNDLKTMEHIHSAYPNVSIYCGGCLAQRFDIELPDYVRRLDVARSENTPISKETFNKIDYKKPFWNKNLRDDADLLETGNLFRHFYPLKTGAGCHGKCKYCTIRDTRGESYYVEPEDQIEEFLTHENVVLVSDAPTAHQISEWCKIAMEHNKPISFRNVEPTVAVMCRESLLKLASAKLLKIFHCPVQSLNEKVLAAMNRDVKATLEYVEMAQELRKLGVIVATNIIIDYVVDGVIYSAITELKVKELFDYYSWNPYFDGKFNYEEAENRFMLYIMNQ